jgi:RNA polymerase sigma-70 factor (ECF subfamily)
MTALLKRVRQGGAAERDLIFQQCYPLITNHLRALGADPDLLEECRQEVLLKLAQWLDDVRHPEAIISWIAQTTTRQFREMARKPEYRHRKHLSIDGGVSESALADRSRHYADAANDVIDLDSALAALPLALKEPFVLAITYGMKAQQIADELNISRDAAYKRLARANAEMRERMSATPSTPPPAQQPDKVKRHPRTGTSQT